MGKLTPKQSIFVKEYLIDLNGTQAAIRAGYSPKTANEQAARLLAHASVSEAVANAMAKRAEKIEINADYVLAQAVKLHERCMQEIEPMTDRRGEPIVDDMGRQVYVFNAAGAAKALELVGKHVGVGAFTEKVQLSGPDSGPVQIGFKIIDGEN